MLCDYYVTRGYGDHPPLTIAASVERRRRSAYDFFVLVFDCFSFFLILLELIMLCDFSVCFSAYDLGRLAWT